MPKIEKALRREKAHRRKRYGMTLVGNSTRRVMRALAAREQAQDSVERPVKIHRPAAPGSPSKRP